MLGWFRGREESPRRGWSLACGEFGPLHETLRAFLAIEVPEDVKAVLAGLCRQLGEMGLGGLRHMRPEGVHLTLKFLGYVSADVADTVVSEVGLIAAEAPVMSLRLADLGVFPTAGPARVLWVGVGDDTSTLEEVWLRIEAVTEKLGFPPEGRGFTPHLTLARVRSGASSSERRRIRAALSSLSYEPGLPFETDAVALMSSTLGPAGASYRQLARLPLRAEVDGKPLSKVP